MKEEKELEKNMKNLEEKLNNMELAERKIQNSLSVITTLNALINSNAKADTKDSAHKTINVALQKINESLEKL